MSESPGPLALGLPLNLAIAVFSAAGVLLLSLVLLCFCKRTHRNPEPALSDLALPHDPAAQLHAAISPESQRAL
jgi:hypothetical protein